MADVKNPDNKSKMGISPNPRNNLFKSKKFWALTALIVILIVAGSAVYIVTKNSRKTAQQPTAKQKTYSEVSNDSLALTGNNKPADAAQAWEEYLKANPSKADQYNAYKQLGVSYMNVSQYEKAKDAFEKAKAISNDNDTQILSALAQIDEREGRTQTAIDEYKNIITILQAKLKTQDSMAQFQTLQDITTLQRTIERLGGTP